MKTVRKAVLAASVAAALAPISANAETTLFGNFDIAVGIESGEETAIAIQDSPAGDDVIGIEGSIETDHGEITYQYIANIDPDADDGDAFGANYHSYVGFKCDRTGMELRLGNQDLPLRLTMDQADLFAGTYADQNNIIAANGQGMGNTTAPSSIMLLGGSGMISYAVSIDSANGEDANDEDPNDGLRFGAMIDVEATDNIAFAVGYESLKDQGSAIGVTANFVVTDALGINVGVNAFSEDTDNVATDSDTTELVLGAAYALGDATTLKLQLAQLDVDESDADDPTLIALGADFYVNDNATLYVLYASSTDGAPLGNGVVESDNDGDASVIAGGIKVSF